MRVGLCMHVGMCVYACASSEGPHAGKGWGSVGRRDSYIQVISNLEALRLQRHGVIRALPARHCTANILQPERGGGTGMYLNIQCAQNHHLASGLLVLEWYQPIHFPSGIRVDDVKTEMGPLFPGLWINFLHQARQLLQSSIHP